MALKFSFLSLILFSPTGASSGTCDFSPTLFIGTKYIHKKKNGKKNWLLLSVIVCQAKLK